MLQGFKPHVEYVYSQFFRIVFSKGLEGRDFYIKTGIPNENSSQIFNLTYFMVAEFHNETFKNT